MKNYKSWLMLLPALLLLGVSLLLLSVPVEPLMHWVGDPQLHLRMIRQGAYGLLALALAWSVGRFLPLRLFLERWYVFPALLFLVMIAAPISVMLGWGRFISGYGWWARSTGVITFLLALVFSLSAALPRVAGKTRGASRALSAILALSVLVPVFFLRQFGILCVGGAVTVLACSATLPLKRLAVTLGGLAAFFICALFVWGMIDPDSLMYLFSRSFEGETGFQLRQALVAVNSGGVFGCITHPTWIPEWHTDFIFARLCGAGGMVAGILCLFLVGILFTCAWRIVARQSDLRDQVAAAGCVAVLTAQPLLHIAVNLGLLPTMESHFPFLSYGPKLVLLDGLLVGLLIAFNRTKTCVSPDEVADAEPSAGAPASSAGLSRWTPAVVMGGIWLVLACFGIRMCMIVFYSPGLHRVHLASVNRIEERLNLQHKPQRGRIFDTADRLLAQNGQMHIICADPLIYSTSDDQHLLPELARLIGMDEQAVRARLVDTRCRYVRLKRDIPPATVKAVRELGMKAFFFDSVLARDYPFDTPLAHLVGCTGVEDNFYGLSGLEMTRNSLLKKGIDVRLTLDIDLQTALQGLAERTVEETGAKQCQIVMMDARTGAIRAAAQVPALHGRASHGDIKPLLWQASGVVFEPGGLLKPLVAAAALERGVITPESRINCEQGMWIYKGLPMRDPGHYDELTPAEILQKSSNIGMAKIGLLLGEGPLYEAVAGWGLNQKCGAGLNSGEIGILHATNLWSKLEVTRLPIGHSCAVTLLQLLRAYSALFNDGRMMEPTLIDATRLAPGVDWHPVPIAESKPVIRPETAVWLRTTLEKKIGGGLTTIGQLANAQKPFPDKSGYDPDRILTAFIGTLDLDNTPHLVAVWLDEPGSDRTVNTAVKIFRQAVEIIKANEGGQDWTQSGIKPSNPFGYLRDRLIDNQTVRLYGLPLTKLGPEAVRLYFSLKVIADGADKRMIF